MFKWKDFTYLCKFKPFDFLWRLLFDYNMSLSQGVEIGDPLKMSRNNDSNKHNNDSGRKIKCHSVLCRNGLEEVTLDYWRYRHYFALFKNEELLRYHTKNLNSTTTIWNVTILEPRCLLAFPNGAPSWISPQRVHNRTFHSTISQSHYLHVQVWNSNPLFVGVVWVWWIEVRLSSLPDRSFW